ERIVFDSNGSWLVGGRNFVERSEAYMGSLTSLANQVWNSMTHRFQSPETMSTPTVMRRPPPRRIISRCCRRKKDRAPINLLDPNAIRMNGKPRTRQYTNTKKPHGIGHGDQAENNNRT